MAKQQRNGADIKANANTGAMEGKMPRQGSPHAPR